MLQIFLQKPLQMEIPFHKLKYITAFNVVNTYIQNVIAQDYKVKLDKDVVSMQVAVSMSNGVTMQLSNNDLNLQLKNAANEMFHH